MSKQFSYDENRAAAQLWHALLRGEHPDVWRHLSVRTVWSGVLDGPAFAALAEAIGTALETLTLTEVLDIQPDLQPFQQTIQAFVADQPSSDLAADRLQAWLQPRSQAFRNHHLTLYLLKFAVVHEEARIFLGNPSAPLYTAMLDVLEKHEAEVGTLKRYLSEEGQVRIWTRKTRALEALLPYLAKLFELQRTYTEAEVTQVLQPWLTAGDVAEVRRTLIEYGWLARTPNGAVYWRVSQEADPSASR
ncbi:DUF2087 domain-containing protein [Deinococcus sp. QL22]|uniref:DUF2087 domain-containing protein n=1 Tax=Deinococcus sp. QL22 TaxID=2939437 RepID=UPI00201785D9|nr:DUF2087 domain-containing protein [Deinococcus sp. QL22]UQN08495.1 DUF2087 domain-containing protein [Deinococcus sp. QL22]